jgi:hypothetical protein
MMAARRQQQSIDLISQLKILYDIIQLNGAVTTEKKFKLKFP